jgi:signal transduction histidine kinase
LLEQGSLYYFPGERFLDGQAFGDGTLEELPRDIADYWRSRNIVSGMLTPVVMSKRVVGLLEVIDYDTPKKRNNGAWQFTIMVSTLLGQAVVQQHVEDELQQATVALAEMGHMRSAISKELDDIKRWKNQLFSSFTHHVQTPLYTLLGFSATLLENEEMDEDKEIRHTCLQHIYEQSTRLTNLVSELMYASELQLNNTTLKHASTDIRKMLSELRDLFRVRTKKDGCEFYCELPEEPLIVDCDIEQINQLLFHLLRNALTRSKTRQWISMKVIPGVDSLTIKISDNGDAIPQEHLDRAFEPFSTTSLNPEVARQTNLGLSIASDIVDLHHGFITVESKGGEETVFSVVLPRKQPV